jgi:ABC-2 type transport system ATP-binding protein
MQASFQETGSHDLQAPDSASAGAARTPAIRTRELTKRFGECLAVDRVSLDIAPQQNVGLLGPNGAGKSTLIKMLTTLLPPTSGQGWVTGLDIGREAARVRGAIGYVPQMLSADGALTGYENLLTAARLYAVPRRERAQRIRDALTRMGLGDAAHTPVRGYSGGMIRRLEIAQAMLHRPAVLFLDEPTVGLDPAARDAMWAHLRQLQQQLQTTILLTTHYMEEAEQLCDRVAILDRGRIVADGSPAQLKARAGQAASLEEAFIRLTGSQMESGGNFRDVVRTRRTARRLG